MDVKVTLIKLKQAVGGIMKDDTNDLASVCQVVVPSENILAVTPGQVRVQRFPYSFQYTLIRSSDGVEKIVLLSDSPTPNPWSGRGKMISIIGATKSGEPVDGWNVDTWNIKEPITIDEFTITDVAIESFTESGDNRFLVLAKITILDSQNVVFGDEFCVEHSGYLLLSFGITVDGPQEIDLANGKNIDHDGAIVRKIEILGSTE